MTEKGLMIFLAIIIVVPFVLLVLNALLYGFLIKPLFVKVGEKPSNAFIPIYNMCRLGAIADLPSWFFLIFLLIPPGLTIWRFVISFKLVEAFDLGDNKFIYFLILFSFLPIGCYMLGHNKYTYLLDEEQVVKAHQQGFTTSKDDSQK